MANASLTPEGTRRQSHPLFIGLSFLLSHAPTVDPTVHIYGADGSVRQVDAVVLLRQPCLMCRPVLQGVG
eukprot:scaffold5595_cov91-Cylindrotheca_fusiformis.AAC.1